MLRFIGKHFKSISGFVLIFYALFFAASVYYIGTHLKFNYELESFFPDSDPSLDFYKEHLSRFESDHDVLLIALENKKGIFSADFLQKVNRLTGELKELENVRQVFSPLKLVRYAQDGPLITRIPFFHPGSDEKLAADSVLISQTRHFVRNWINPQAGSLLLIVKTMPGIGIDKTKEFLDKAERLLEDYGFDGVHLAGRVKAQLYIVSNMQKEFFILAGLTLCIILGFLWFTFRNFWGIVLPVLTVLLGLVATLDFALFFGEGINLLSIIIPTILFVVGISDSVHILNNYYFELRNGTPKDQALLNTLKDIGFATFLTALTASVGFATLSTLSIRPIVWFGICAAMGILIVFAISFTFVIAALYFLPATFPEPGKGLVRGSFFEKLLPKVFSSRFKIAFAFGILLIPVFIGISRIRVNNFFTEELREGDPYKKDFDYFDRMLGGVRPFELSYEVKGLEHGVLNPEIIARVETLTGYLEKNYQAGGILSPNIMVKSMHQMLKGGAEDAFTLPQDSSGYVSLSPLLLSFSDKEEFKALVSGDLRFGRIAGRIPDLGSVEVARRNEELKKYLNTLFDKNQVEFRITGISEVIDSNNNYLTSNLLDGLFYELLAIGLIMGTLFRSFRMTVVSLIPNIIPLLFIGGLLGWLEINLNLSSAIIFNIAFGITVDDTIHLLAAYKLFLRKGHSREEALRHAYMHSGKAVTMTSFILFGGFIILTVSSFTGIHNTGVLVSATLGIALLSDLLLMPLLLKWFKQ